MKIAYIMSTFDHSDIKYKYSVGWFLVDSLKKHGIDVIPVGPFTEDFSFLKKVKQKLYRIIFHKNYWRHRDVNVIKSIAQKVSQKLETLEFDAVFAFGSLNTAFVKTNKPIYYLTDSIFQGLLNYNIFYSNLTDRTISNGIIIEDDAFNRSKRVFVSSEWALNSIKQAFPKYINKTAIVPLGGNLLKENTVDDIKIFIKLRQKSETINFVFIGYNWLNKGGHESVSVIDLLINHGFKCKLTVLGPELIPENDQRDYIDFKSAVNKFSDSGFEIFDKALKEAHFFILPSKFEAFGHVFCEACSYGVPCIGNGTGGITTVISNNKNGKYFNFPNEISDCVTYLESLIKDKYKYSELSISSFNEYQTRLNWKTSIGTIIKYIKNDLTNLP